MPPWLLILLRRFGIRAALALAAWLVRKAKERLDRNLSAREQREVRTLLAKSKGRRKNLTERERERLMYLVRKAVGRNEEGLRPRR